MGSLVGSSRDAYGFRISLSWVVVSIVRRVEVQCSSDKESVLELKPRCIYSELQEGSRIAPTCGEGAAERRSRLFSARRWTSVTGKLQTLN